MNYKNLKLGAKLAVGFGILILISLLLGGIAVYNMTKITTESEFLANEYVPEVKIATDLRGAANRVMYAMRGYGYTEEEDFYSEALKEINLINTSISEGEELNKQAKRLVKLAGELEVAKEKTETYKGLVDQTVTVNKALAENRIAMDNSAALYVENCNKYLEDQDNTMLKEISSGETSWERLSKIMLITEIINTGNQIRVDNFKSQAKRDTKIFQETLNEFPEVYRLIEEIRVITKTNANMRALEVIEEEVTSYEKSMKAFLENWTKREDLAQKRDAAGKELIAACVSTADAGLSGTQNIADDTIKILRASNATMIIGLIIAVLIGILTAVSLTRIITGPIIKGVAFAKQLSEGDLTATIEVDQKDEVGQLAAALTNMASKLREIVENILSGADNIASASQQMSSTSQEMSQGASEQASSVEEVSSSMEEMASNIENNTDNAQQTEKIAINAASGIKEGSEATNIAVEGMKNIAEKIRIVNDIAFQTNILALNAAVEAARAGEHGKGFAVVAAEVRKLAERSKIAADEIDELSKNGVDVAEKAGRKLNEIVPDIEKTAQLVQEIASASIEQNSGADQINNALQQLNNVTQQNAAASEELATSSEELAGQADQLKENIMFFKTGHSSIKSRTSFKKPKAASKMSYSSKPLSDKGKKIELETIGEMNDNEFESF